MLPFPLLLCILSAPYVASVTIYSQLPLGYSTQTATATSPNATVPAAYNTTVLNPPLVPNPPPATQFTLELQASSSAVTSPLSIPQSGSFLGFSIEMSVVTQVRLYYLPSMMNHPAYHRSHSRKKFVRLVFHLDHKDLMATRSFIQPPFLNLMANIAERGGSVRVRTGGNTQDYAAFTYEIPNANGKCIGKEAGNTNNPVWFISLRLLAQLSDSLRRLKLPRSSIIWTTSTC
jgi:hypothetical protein